MEYFFHYAQNLQKINHVIEYWVIEEDCFG
jgi:hypothetical protein